MNPALAPKFEPSEVTLTVMPDSPVLLRLIDEPINSANQKHLKVQVEPSGVAYFISCSEDQCRADMVLHVAEAFEGEQSEVTYVHEGIPAFQITTGNIYAPSLTIQLDRRWGIVPQL